MNINRYTSMGLGTVIVAALALGACNDDNKNNTQTPAGSASTTASAPSASAAASAAPSASAAASATPPAESDDDKLATEEVIEHHRYHHGGITSFIAMSLDTLGVAPERKAAVEKIQHDLDARMLPLHEAQKALISKLADGVAAGTVDPAKADADLAVVAKASGTVRTASAELINELHKTLAPVERAALVDKVQAHWEVWRNANESATAEAKEEKEHGRLERLTKELTLTPDQVDKIKAGIKASTGPIEPKLKTDIDERLNAFSTSFASDKFDAKTLSAWEPDDPHLATAGATRMVHLCEAAAPVLTPEQRTKFAEQLRSHRLEMPAAPATEKKKENP